MAAGEHAKHTSTVRRGLRWVFWLAGTLALILGAIGVVVPGLPTTPFVLLAASCYVRASPRAHAWLLRTRAFGPMLREWERHRSVPRRVKVIALVTMTITGGVSVWHFAAQPALQAVVISAILVGVVVVLKLPSRHQRVGGTPQGLPPGRR